MDSRSISSKVQEVWAFDYSKNLIELAKARAKKYTNISFLVLDATNEKDLEILPSDYFHAAVCNMSLMDISDLYPSNPH